MRIAEEFDIKSPVTVSDSGANIKKAIKLAQWERFPCIAHMINLSVKAGIESDDIPEVKHVIEKCKAIVTHFKHSSNATQALKEAAGKKAGKATTLIQEVSVGL